MAARRHSGTCCLVYRRLSRSIGSRHVSWAAVFLRPRSRNRLFLLSGFVISYATEDRPRPVGLREYALRRGIRIYPIFFIALVTSYATYAVNAHELVPLDSYTLAGNLLMLQDLKGLKAGAWIEVYKGNDPLWSLSYECWFYAFFALFLYCILIPKRIQQPVVLALAIAGSISYMVLPSFAGSVLAYLSIWWCGVELNREYKTTGRVSWLGQRFSIFALMLLAVLWTIPVSLTLIRRQHLGFGTEPILQVRHFSAAVLVMLVVLLYTARPSRHVDRILLQFLPIGRISFSLYVLHWPVLHLSNGVVQMIGLILLLPTCYLLEGILQPRIVRLTRQVLGFAEGRVVQIV